MIFYRVDFVTCVLQMFVHASASITCYIVFTQPQQAVGISFRLKAGYSPPERTNLAESALAYLENNKDRIFPYKTILGAAHNLRIYPAGNDQYQIKIE